VPTLSTPPFTPRDWRMIQLAADGFRYRDIAPRVGYRSRDAAKNRFKLLLDAAGVDNIAHLVAFAFRKGKII
jgi:DNA-binding NarL/FixJ family response regulator